MNQFDAARRRYFTDLSKGQIGLTDYSRLIRAVERAEEKAEKRATENLRRDLKRSKELWA